MEYACGALQHLAYCLDVYGTIPTSPVMVRRWENTHQFEHYIGPMQLELFYAWILFQDQNHHQYQNQDQNQKQYQNRNQDERQTHHTNQSQDQYQNLYQNQKQDQKHIQDQNQ